MKNFRLINLLIKDNWLLGILNRIIEYFDIDDGLSGFIQTAFFAGFILSAPLFGYLGDRFPRKWIIIFGVSFWSSMTLLGSFVSQNVIIFLFFFFKLTSSILLVLTYRSFGCF